MILSMRCLPTPTTLRFPWTLLQTTCHHHSKKHSHAFETSSTHRGGRTQYWAHRARSRPRFARTAARRRLQPSARVARKDGAATWPFGAAVTSVKLVPWARAGSAASPCARRCGAATSRRGATRSTTATMRTAGISVWRAGGRRSGGAPLPAAACGEGGSERGRPRRGLRTGRHAWLFFFPRWSWMCAGNEPSLLQAVLGSLALVLQQRSHPAVCRKWKFVG